MQGFTSFKKEKTCEKIIIKKCVLPNNREIYNKIMIENVESIYRKRYDFSF